MKKHQNIFLIGPMGAGKSSVGKYLAEQLEMHFYDSDEEIENRTGVDIGWIFDLEGAAGFRKREIAVIAELVHLPNIVLATGGGSIISPEVQELLRTQGVVVFLDASLGSQQIRTVNEARRPLLRVPNREKVIEKLYEEHTPLYQALADYYILTDDRSVHAVAEEIINWLNKK
ncbi:MAG: aroK 2 [Gammaproteobacteria bacterium]|jgi:shikimate kinase|nr:aroK 2 [Gammaproteobacteria bacterium]